MDKLKMQTADMAERNIEILGQMFPNCLTEVKNEEGKIVRAIDFDKLRQELACEVVEGAEERYQFTWPDKRNAIRLANAPTNKTLRPCREDSVDFDNTENLYIEGDNLEVLKLLRENYLGKVKMIYIDPPYNTGNDFVYNDAYDESKNDFESRNGLYNEEGEMMMSQYERNTESNGRFHTDWLNMIYPRLKVARDLLSDDGAVYVSMNDNEICSLKSICNEVFGESNFISQLVWANKEGGGGSDSKHFRIKHEYILVYAKNIDTCTINGVEISNAERYKKSDEYVNTRGKYYLQQLGMGSLGYIATLDFPIIAPDGTEIYPNKDGRKINRWRWSKEKVKWGLENGYIEFTKDRANDWVVSTKQYLRADNEGNIIDRTNRPFALIEKYSSTSASKNLQLMLEGRIFDYSKPVDLIEFLIKTISEKKSIILDFFSGSATTAHAVMQLNAEDGGNRKFIMVQLPEKTDEKSEARKAGYNTICEIGKERIRRAGKKIREDIQDKIQTLEFSINALINAKPSATAAMLPKQEQEAIAKKVYNEQILPKMKEKEQLELRLAKLDTGFRVLKLDSSNMKDVYYTPAETPIQQTLGFDELVDNIKWDERTPEDLLFQVLPECNLPLSSKIEEREIHGKKVFVVEDGYLIACFDKDINESVITAIAKEKPYYFVMCDRSIATDNVADNFDQIFNAYSKETVRRIL